ncbi:MAG: probable large, multifunctional secreted protein, partial [uncultured Cytophagales bacterium]
AQHFGGHLLRSPREAGRLHLRMFSARPLLRDAGHDEGGEGI